MKCNVLITIVLLACMHDLQAAEATFTAAELAQLQRPVTITPPGTKTMRTSAPRQVPDVLKDMKGTTPRP
jgi:hypothetical protein